MNDSPEKDPVPNRRPLTAMLDQASRKQVLQVSQPLTKSLWMSKARATELMMNQSIFKQRQDLSDESLELFLSHMEPNDKGRKTNFGFKQASVSSKGANLYVDRAL